MGTGGLRGPEPRVPPAKFPKQIPMKSGNSKLKPRLYEDLFVTLKVRTCFVSQLVSLIDNFYVFRQRVCGPCILALGPVNVRAALSMVDNEPWIQRRKRSRWAGVSCREGLGEDSRRSWYLRLGRDS